jgi:MFS transporter, Spinster family, sphingosine-1-phosphate transporter
MLPLAGRTLKYAWLVVALLWPVALLNYLDRQMLAAMKFSVMADIPSIGSEANWGQMLGQFKWVYAALSPVGGYLADRFSRRFTICGSLFVWSAVTWGTGHVTTFSGLLWTRSLMGISEAFYIPAALALIADYHASPTRSRAVGTHQMAIYVGVIIGGFSGYIADAPALGWRWAFDACGLAGICYALPLALLLRDAPPPALAAAPAGNPAANPPTPPRVPPSPLPGESTGAQGRAAGSPVLENPRHRMSPLAAVVALLTNGSFVLLVLYFTLPALAGWVVRDWMPAILKQQFHIGQGKAGVSATLYWQAAAIVGAILGGWLADRWMRRHLRGRIYVSALGMCLIIPALFGVGNAGTLAVAVGFLLLFGLGWGFFDGNNMPILCQIVRPELRATGYGIMNLVSISCGGFADWGFGAMRDAHVPLNVIFSAFATTAVVSVVLVLLIQPKSGRP